MTGQVRPHDRRRIRCVVPPAHRRAPGRPGHRVDEQAVPAARLATADRPLHRIRVDGMGTSPGAGPARPAAWRRAGRHRDDGGTAAGHPGMAAVPDHPDRGRRGRGGPRRPDAPVADSSGGLHRRGTARRADTGLARDSRADSGFQTDHGPCLHRRHPATAGGRQRHRRHGHGDTPAPTDDRGLEYLCAAGVCPHTGPRHAGVLPPDSG